MWKIFQGCFDTPINRPTPRALTTGFGALATALALPAIIPNTSYAFLAAQTLFASGTFIAGAHRNHAVRVRALVVLPLIVAAISIRHYPLNTIPAFLLCYAFYIFGNAWKYWYLQQDPARLSPHYRYFKDPNTQPQQHIIYALFLTPPLFLFTGSLIVTLQGTGLFGERITFIAISILVVGCLVFALTHIVIGIVQFIRKALHRRSASPNA
ncbi:hypothetical protein [Schaalia sp. Marseille-Q2122]|uniref:hypothetical protein n=1 Tax=Schaalia sp. Marseille-Q2122 TaxID=2736604 RepID=UPI0015882B5C|nr:hypothetical protein [Schaalia sp. Marseille-Q2122]